MEQSAIELSGRRQATYYILHHMHNSTKVHIPETGFNDDEGVLIDWYFVSQTDQVVLRKKKIQQTNIMLFELRLQELAASRRSSDLALHWDNPITVFDETNLDAFIRSLCMRESNMLSLNPNLSVPRKHGNGRFCLQEYLTPRGNFRYLSHYNVQQKGVEILRGLYTVTLDHTRIARDKCPSEHESILRQCVMEVVSHLKSMRAISIEEMTLEWIFFVTQGRETPILVGAQYIRAHENIPSDPKIEPFVKIQRGLEEINRNSRKEPWEPHAAQRMVCRHCQRPRELELEKELTKVQGNLRQTLTTLQKTQEEYEQSKAEVISLKKKVNDLDITVHELHNQLKREGANAKTAMLGVQQQIEKQSAEMEQLRDKLHESNKANEGLQEALDVANRRLANSSSEAETKLNAMREDMRNLEQQLSMKEIRISEVIADWTRKSHVLEEALAFRDYMFRRLADMTQPGVHPPKRCAGGFGSYPCPTASNVAEVVQTLVDSKTKWARSRSAHRKWRSTTDI